MVDGPMTPGSRRIINACYDDVQLRQPDAFTYMMQEIQRLEMELGNASQHWRPMWERLESPNREALRRQMSLSTQYVKSHGRSLHKRSTIEILVKVCVYYNIHSAY